MLVTGFQVFEIAFEGFVFGMIATMAVGSILDERRDRRRRH